MEISSQDKVLSVKCPLHPCNSSDFLFVAAKTGSHRACIDCILGGIVHPFAALDLKSLFQAAGNEDFILKNYPPLCDPTIYQRLEIIQQFSTGKMIEQIEQYISDLKRTFDEILQKLQKDSHRSVKELGQQRRQVLDLYQSLCEPNKLKEAVTQDLEAMQESSLHELILKKRQDSVINTNKLGSAISQFEVNRQKFSMKWVNESCERLRNISFFTSQITPLFFRQSILKEFQLVPSNLFDSASRTVISRKENNQLNVKCIQNNGNACELYTSYVLDNNWDYLFHFAFHQEATEGPPQFYIGLINEKDKDKTTDSNLFLYYENNQDCDINTIIKGVAPNSSRNAKNVHKEIVMSVHLASRTVKVGDVPNFNNVVELTDKTKIREGCQYCLIVGVGFKNNHLTLTDVIVARPIVC